MMDRNLRFEMVLLFISWVEVEVEVHKSAATAVSNYLSMWSERPCGGGRI
jgi:hypothetical protein